MLVILLSQLFGLLNAYADTETYPDPSTQFHIGTASSFTQSGQIPTGFGPNQWVQIDVRTYFGKWNGLLNPACLEERKEEQAAYYQKLHGRESAERELKSEIAQKEANADEITESLLDPDLPEAEETQLRNRRDHLKDVIVAKKAQLAELKKQKISTERPLDGVHNSEDYFDVYAKNHAGHAFPYGRRNGCLNTHSKGTSDTISTPFEMVIRIPINSATSKSIDYFPLLRIWLGRYIASNGWAMNILGMGSKAYENGLGRVAFYDLLQVDFNRVIPLRDDRGITLTLKGMAGIHYMNSGGWDAGVFRELRAGKTSVGKYVPADGFKEGNTKVSSNGRSGLDFNAGFTSRIKFSSGFMAELQNSLDWIHSATDDIGSTLASGTLNTSGDLLALTSVLKAGFQSESEKWGVFAYVKREGAFQREKISRAIDEKEVAIVDASTLSLLGGLEFEWHW